MDNPSGTSLLAMAIAGVVLTVIATVFVIISTRKKWEVLKPELFPELSATAAQSAADEMASFRPWPRLLPNLLGSSLDNTVTALRNETGIALKSSLKVTPDWTSRGPEVAGDSLDSSDIRSILCEQEGRYVYLVAVPNRHEHPSLLQKYACFASGWTAHFEVLRDSLAAQPDFSFVAGFLMCIDPDGKDGALFCSVADRETLAVPVALVPQSDLRAGSGDSTLMVVTAGGAARSAAAATSVSSVETPRVAVGGSV